MTGHSPLLSWQPPTNYQKIKSNVDGIAVYAPIPESEKASLPITFKCPNCGAPTKYDVAAGGIACEHCGYIVPVSTSPMERRSAVSEFTLEALNKSSRGWKEHRRTLHCDSCGAELAVTPQTLATTCPFCASNKVNLSDATGEDVLRPHMLIPFKIKGETNRERAREWLGQGWFHPKELAMNATLDRFTGIYLPFWIFNADITADWRAEVGYEQTRRYYDGGSNTWRTRTEINWRWEDGRVQIGLNDLIVPATSHINQRIFQRILPYSLDELVVYEPEFLAGWQAQSYDITLPRAWETGKILMRESAKKACYKDIPSNHVRNFSMSADFANESWLYILLPVYLASYQFEGKIFQILINGQSGAIAGQKPVAWKKVWLAIAALLSPGITIGIIGLLLATLGIGIIPMMLALIFLLIGGFIAYQIYTRARESEKP